MELPWSAYFGRSEDGHYSNHHHAARCGGISIGLFSLSLCAECVAARLLGASLDRSTEEWAMCVVVGIRAARYFRVRVIELYVDMCYNMDIKNMYGPHSLPI